MEEFKLSSHEKNEHEIVFSKAIKAGKRIYYLDVKKSRNEDLFVSITESKKKVVGFDNQAQVSFEKHKIFLYKEDFSKFQEGLNEVINFIESQNATQPTATSDKETKITDDLDISFDF